MKVQSGHCYCRGMRTDKHYFKIFEVRPDWAYLLAGIKPPKRLQFRSVAIKELEAIADGVAIPAEPSESLGVIEMQEQFNAEIYPTTAIKMAALQKMYGMRPVIGMIFFGEARLDPQTEPWRHVISSFVLRDAVTAFAERHPDHPLTAVFDPLLARSDEDLKNRANADVRCIKFAPELTDKARDALLNVFASWMLQRFKHLPRREIEAMMLIDLPPLEETVSGKELIQLGEVRGEARGLSEAILVVSTARFQRVPEALRKQISLLSTQTAKALLSDLDQITSLTALKDWLSKHAAKKSSNGVSRRKR